MRYGKKDGEERMRTKIKEIWKLTVSARQQSVSIQHRLILYWILMILSVFAVLLLALSFVGVFSDSENKLAETLNVQQQGTVLAVSKQMNELTAQGISLSNSVSGTLEDMLAGRGLDIDDLNDNPELIAEVEEVIYTQTLSTLYASECSGVFVLLDATANTKKKNAENSRMGVYLRYSDLASTSNAEQRIAYFRGMPEVSRLKQVRMHNRWNLEFDTTQFSCYDTLMNTKVLRLADSCIWNERTNLKDTWENAMLLCVPILDSKGNVCGICGIEVSELYFYLSYPTMGSPYGSMVTMLVPMDDNNFLMKKAMIGDTAGTILEASGTMSIKEKGQFNIYTTETQRYFGLHQKLNGKLDSGLTLAAVTLIPETGYDSQASAVRIRWIIGSLVFLVCMLVLSILLSRRFARSIAEEKELTKNSLPPNIEELLETFKKNVTSLTKMERRVLQYYIDGYSLKEIPELAFISLSTVKTHNTNINKKLNVTSHEELMLYIDLFRRCGRLDEIKSGT